VQLFIIYYGLPDVGIRLPRLWAAVLALGVNSGAYQAEYFRGGLLAVSEGQLQAAFALGMSKTEALRYVVVPQALRLAVPAWTNEAIYLVKYTSVAFTIAVPELLARGRMIISWRFKPLEVLLTVALLYLVLVWGVGKLMEVVEHKTRVPGISMDWDVSTGC